MTKAKKYLSYYNDDYSTIRIETPSGEVLCVLDDEMTVDKIIDELNGLNNRIKELKNGYLKLQKLNDYHYKKNQQLKNQIIIYEKFLEGNNLDIEWIDFCTEDECLMTNEKTDCKDCKYMRWIE